MTEPTTKESPTAQSVGTAPASERKSPSRHMPGGWSWGTGRRKSAVARVRVRPGDGSIEVNERPWDSYFVAERDRKDILILLEATKTTGTLDVRVRVAGGGSTGQAGAVVLGLARALKRYDETLEAILRERKFLTRDPREVERKKYGMAGARRRYQFSKR